MSHINGDGDLLQAWLDYYLRLGISSFHFIAHGTQADNETLYALRGSYPMVIEDAYGGEFLSEEKRRRLTSLLTRMRGHWIVLVDSDEFVELPYAHLSATIRVLNVLGANALYAPLVQRLSRDGSLDSPLVVSDPFEAFPLCSVDLYQRMGVNAGISKFPLFWCGDYTAIREGGNHFPPNGEQTRLSRFIQGATHHFKWRRTVAERLARRATSSHTFRHESVGFQAYLETHGDRVPIDGAFPYSRVELIKQGLVKTVTPTSIRYQMLRHAGRWLS